MKRSITIKPLLSQNKENVPMYYFHSVKDFEDALKKNRHYNLFRGENMTPGNGFLNTLNNTPTAPPLISIYGIESSPIYLKTGSVRNYIAKYDDNSYPRPWELEFKDGYVDEIKYSSQCYNKYTDEWKPCIESTYSGGGNLTKSFYSYDLNNTNDKNRLESIKNYDINKIKETLEKADESIESDVVDFGGWWDWTGWTNVSGKRQRARDKLNEFRVWIGTGINNNTFGKEGGGLEQTMNAEIGAVHTETRTWHNYEYIRSEQIFYYIECGSYTFQEIEQEYRKKTGARYGDNNDGCGWFYYYLPIYSWVSHSTSYPVQEGSDGVVPNKMSVGSGKAGVNDGGKYPAPPNMIQAIPLLGVNHSEMGNNLNVRDAIEDILEGKGLTKTQKDIFQIQTK